MTWLENMRSGRWPQALHAWNPELFRGHAGSIVSKVGASPRFIRGDDWALTVGRAVSSYGKERQFLLVGEGHTVIVGLNSHRPAHGADIRFWNKDLSECVASSTCEDGGTYECDCGEEPELCEEEGHCGCDECQLGGLWCAFHQVDHHNDQVDHHNDQVYYNF